MSKKRTDEQKLLFDNYVSVSTIQRYFSLSKTDAENIFTRAQYEDENSGYIKIYDRKVRSLQVLKLLGLDKEIMLLQYRTKNLRGDK